MAGSGEEKKGNLLSSMGGHRDGDGGSTEKGRGIAWPRGTGVILKSRTRKVRRIRSSTITSGAGEKKKSK